MSAARSAESFRAARDLLFERRDQWEAASQAFHWPELDEFNWALDWFDPLARRVDRTALWIVEEDGTEARSSFADMSARSSQLANWLAGHGVARGDRVVVMLGNQMELWETILAVMKLGAVVIPATTLLGPAELADRVGRGAARHVITRAADTAKFAEVPGSYTRVAVGEPVDGWLAYDEAAGASADFVPDGVTGGADPMLLYFTSGTTAQPKLVEHTHASYPAGHLSTMYWIGLQPGDVHLNISSPGWAKHAWSSIFAPWDAEATVLVFNYERFDAAKLLDTMARTQVTTFCAPPTVWRMLVLADLGAWKLPLREVVSAGEPLNPEVIDQVRDRWGLTVRDGSGQTETTAQIGNSPGQPVKPGSMGRPLPGYTVALVDPVSGAVGDEGEISLDLSRRPLGLMTGYRDDEALTAQVMRDGYYHTGDVASRDAEGYITYVGRIDDVFKASDYRISPFELESVLIEHQAVAEAAVVPSPDPVRLAVPKAYVVLVPGHQPTPETAESVLAYVRDRVAPYKRIRRLEFAELPKTISGKIRRVELRRREEERHAGTDAGASRADGEYWEEDFPELKRR